MELERWAGSEHTGLTAMLRALVLNHNWASLEYLRVCVCVSGDLPNLHSQHSLCLPCGAWITGQESERGQTC